MSRHRLGASAAVVALIALTACGSDSKNTTTTAAAASTSIAASSSTSGSTGTTGTTGTAGSSGTTSVTGATGGTTAGDGSTAGTAAAGSGYKIDASSCPADASKPLAAGEPIKMGITLTMSGPGAAPQLAQGMQAYFAKVNAEDGGVDGHKLEATVKDDGFDAARGVANITEFIQSQGIFAVAAQQGSANIVAAQPVVEKACMPQFFVPAGLPKFGDPVHHPWTSTSQMAYDTEAGLWAQYLDKEFPDGAKVGMLVFNSTFGTDYVAALTKALEGTKHKIVKTSLHEATAVNVDNEVTALIAAGPDVIFGATAGSACTQLMTAADNGGFKGKVVISALCLGIKGFFAPAGAAANGVLQIQSFKDAADPAFAKDKDVQDYVAAVTKYGESGTDPLNGFVAAGYRNAAALIEAMREAAASPEGLSRVNLANKVWNIDYATPLSQKGVKFKMAGDKDAYPVETGTMFSFDVKAGSMVDTGLTLSAEGKTGVYSGG